MENCLETPKSRETGSVILLTPAANLLKTFDIPVFWAYECAKSAHANCMEDKLILALAVVLG